jgi:hypothetical protein
MSTNSTSAAKRQPVIVFVLESYLVLASVVSMAWTSSQAYASPALAYMVWGCILATFGLLIAGTVLLLRGRRGSGWTALAIAGYGILFLVFFLPTLARARTH